MNLFKEKSQRLTDPYVTSGNRLYVIGTQDGLFPDIGEHIKDEMAGVWNHPVKLADGFFIGLREASNVQWITAQSFRTYPFYTEHHYDEESMHVTRRQFVPDDEEMVFVSIEVTNFLSTSRELDILFVIKSDLHTGWLGTESRGHDHVVNVQNQLVFSNSDNPWAFAASSNAHMQEIELGRLDCPFETKGKGVFGSLILPLICEPNQTVTVTICLAGSLIGTDDAIQGLSKLSHYETFWESKQKRYEDIEQTSRIQVPNALLNEMVQWVKFNTDWLVRNVPNIGNGLGAGLPEYPWWFGCDNGYALQGVLAAGGFSLAKDTLRLLASISERENGNGRIIHEVSTTNVVYNPGNTQETPQFCIVVWDVFLWTGDMAFLLEMYPAVVKAIEWTLSMAPDGDDLAVGYGIMEVENLNAKLIDTAVYTQQAFEAYANMSEVLGHAQIALDMRLRASKLREVIFNRFWLPTEGLYADVLVDRQGMNQHLELWANRIAEKGQLRAAEEYRKLIDKSAFGEGPYLLKNWVISTPVEMGIAARKHADRLLMRMRTQEFKAKHGLYLSGTDQVHAMTISTSVQAVAECRYGYVDEAVLWLEQIAGTMDLRMPGSITEMSPDYGCFVQAWTIYGTMVPFVKYMFGVQPMAHLRHCNLLVQMPSSWQEARLENLRVGSNRISLYYQRVETGEQLTIYSAQDWDFDISKPDDGLNKESCNSSRVSVAAGTFATAYLS